jgi:hypothetical protein
MDSHVAHSDHHIERVAPTLSRVIDRASARRSNFGSLDRSLTRMTSARDASAGGRGLAMGHPARVGARLGLGMTRYSVTRDTRDGSRIGP